MRAILASSIGVACTAALVLPLTPPASAAPAARAASAPAELPGSTRSLPLRPVGSDRALGGTAAQGLSLPDVAPFSLVGVVWDDPERELRGTVQVRTHATRGDWSRWEDVETHNHEHAADPGSAERTRARVRGATAPLWVGDSDGVQVRVRPAAPGTGRAAAAPLPAGLHLELVDPGPGKSAPDGTRAGAPAPRGATVIPALSKEETEAEAGGVSARPFVGARPRIVTRRGWGADEKLREKGSEYGRTVHAAFVHHSATGNQYSCAQSPAVMRSIYRYHVKSSGWRDFGYNFAVDKCGTIFEGRAGGVDRPVTGAHTLGFNTDSMGIAVLGTYTDSTPPPAAVNAVARLTAWKLGLYGVNPRAKTVLKSGGGNLYKKGRKVRLNVISGHRDGFATECPGGRLYKKLGKARTTSAKYQGRR
ncbi:peptidoglycan recognition protein [Streptomyces sp. NPDC001941]|uniref:peptidoglycan recognition protein family protein n=1 Tax=Streptomyces sp. NPDC001941 TaxID=3154659 RepID=UPI00332D905E